jgi:dsDNA-binding SOS-regulon protein
MFLPLKTREESAMSIEVIYRVLKQNGELAGEYMDKKLADSHDQKLDSIYAIADLIKEQAKDLDFAVVEGIAEHLVDNRQAVVAALKKIKDSPADPKANSGKGSNVETLEPRQAVNS